jgi:hypothetical protein
MLNMTVTKEELEKRIEMFLDRAAMRIQGSREGNYLFKHGKVKAIVHLEYQLRFGSYRWCVCGYVTSDTYGAQAFDNLEDLEKEICP